MRILYHSAAPWVGTGYGRCTQEIAPRVHNSGHEVAIQTLGSLNRDSIWWHGDELYYDMDDPMRIMPTQDPNGKNTLGMNGVPGNFSDFDADLYFTHFDTWINGVRQAIANMKVPYASYVIVDHYPAPQAVVEQVMNANRVIAMSKWAKMALEQRGVRPIYIPHGVNTDNFYPNKDNDRATIDVKTDDDEMKEVDLNDRFVVGIVSANIGDRKQIPKQLMAFNMFLNNVDSDAILYLHSDASSGEGFRVAEVANEIGIPKENIMYCPPNLYGSVGDDYLNDWYNNFDVLLNCSIGESWGLTITEAMATETPVIATNFSSMPEQLGMNPGDTGEQLFSLGEGLESRGGVTKAPHGVLVNPCVPIWRERVSSQQAVPHHQDIFQAIKYYYDHPEVREADGIAAREHVMNNYTWEDHVVPSFINMFDQIEMEIT